MEKKKQTVVIVSGGYSILHIGHIAQFKAAKELGDHLVVILNSDEFLIRKKGYCVVPFVERKAVLEAIRYIDAVIKCADEDQTVCRSLEMLYKEFLDEYNLIFAKGGDRTVNNIPEKETCERLGIKMVFGVGGDKVQSSSDIEGRIRNGKS